MGRRPPCVQCWSLLIKINILGSAAGCDAGWCWDWARPPQLWPGRLQHEATVARPSQQWWHYRQCAEVRAGGHTSPPHQSPVVTLVRLRLVRSAVQWQWVNSDSEPTFLPVDLSQIFPKFSKGFKTFQPFEVDILLFVKAEPISQIVCIESIYIESESSFEP